MAQMAILFDSSRCSACQACAAACTVARRAPLPVSDGQLGGPVADGYQRAADLDDETVLVVALDERTVDSRGLVWEITRKSCVHCVEAPCAEVCPTGALSRDEETGLVLVSDGRCVGCHLCSLACPIDVPRHNGRGGSIAKCDGCADRVRNGQAPACVEACPLDALRWGEREEIVAEANERVARLQERGFEGAQVLGVDEQGGHQVIQVLKYGVEGSVHAPLANTGETPWISSAKMAGPVSVGVLGVGALGAAGALAWELRKEERARAAARAVPVNVMGAMVPGTSRDSEPFGPTGSEGAAMSSQFDDAYLDGDFTDEDAARAAEARDAAREAAVREAETVARIAAPTPAAAAAATATEVHLYPVTFDEAAYDEGDKDSSEMDELDESEGADDSSLVDDLGNTGEIPMIDELEDTGEIPVISDTEDTGELYDVNEFNRLLAADIVAHHLAKEAEKEACSSEEAAPSGGDGPADGAGSVEETARADGTASVEEEGLCEEVDPAEETGLCEEVDPVEKTGSADEEALTEEATSAEEASCQEGLSGESQSAGPEE